MKTFIAATTFAALALLLPTAPAALAADGDSTGWMSDGNALYITLGLSSLNLSHDPAMTRWTYPDNALDRSGRNVAAEAGVFFVKAISMGIRYEYHTADYTTTRPILLGLAEIESLKYETRLNEVLVDLRAWIPPRHGLIAGAAIGYGSADLGGNEAFSGSGPVYQFYSGFAFALGEGNAGLTVMRAGYAVRDFGTIGDSADPAGASDFDLSGWFLEFSFGGIAKIKNH